MRAQSMQADTPAKFGNWRRALRQVTYGTELAAGWDQCVRAAAAHTNIIRERASDKSTTAMTRTIKTPFAKRKYNRWVVNETLEDHALHQSTFFSEWLNHGGQDPANERGLNLLQFGAATAVIFPLIAQNEEQADFLRLAVAYYPRSCTGTCTP